MTLQMALSILGVFIAIAAFVLAGGAQYRRLKIILGAIFFISAIAAIFYFMAPYPFPPLPSTPPVVVTAAPIPPHTKYASDDFSSPGSGWDIIKNDPTGTADYSGAGTYQLNVNGGKFYSSLWPELGDIGTGDFTLQVKALGPWDDQGVREQGIVTGWNGDTGIPTYAFTLTSRAECKIRKRKPGFLGLDQGRGTWPVEVTEKIANPDTNKTVHDLLLVKQGSMLTGYVDGQFCAQYEMVDYRGGLVGVAMLGPGKSSFDDFAVSTVP